MKFLESTPVGEEIADCGRIAASEPHQCTTAGPVPLKAETIQGWVEALCTSRRG